MLIHIILHEIRRNILSLRLQIALVLMVVVFGFGAAAFVMNLKSARENYRRYSTNRMEMLRGLAEENLSGLATNREDYILAPRGNAFIDDAGEKYLPNSIRYSAYNVFGFEVRPGSVNPYLSNFRELNWMFIISIILGFTVFLFTFDSISGEKESKTLAGSLSNSLSRGTLLMGKFISVVLTSVLVLIPGICLSLVIILASGAVSVTATTILETAVFVAAASVFVACIAAFGLLASVVSRSSNVSLLVSLALWLLFVAIVPNTAIFWAQKLFPIENSGVINQRVSNARMDINRNAPEGSWASSSNNPFLPQHELRAANQTNLMNAEKHIRDAYVNDMIRQLERVRLVTLVSPVSLFEHMSETIVEGGYSRILKNWSDMHLFRERFFDYFKEKDANDPESPHWYNPFEDYSTTRKGVNFEETPVYNEIPHAIHQRIAALAPYFMATVVYAAVVFFATFILFVRYDVR